MSKKLMLVLTIIILIFTTCVSSSPNHRNQPDWVLDPYSRLNRNEYIAVVGSGNSRQDAERNALNSLVAQFGQSIQVDERVSTIYQETVRNTIVNWSEVTTAETVIALSTGINTLVGAEIGEFWKNSTGTYYTIAILNRARAGGTYTDMVRANLAMIDKLVNISTVDRNTLNSFARFQIAATIADLTVIYGNLLQQVGFPYPGIRNGDTYRLEAASIRQNIPIRISVKKEAYADRGGRIEAAFARAFSDLGFLSGGTGSRYVLEVEINLTVVPHLNNSTFNSRIEMNANLIDVTTQMVLLPYFFAIRVGHTASQENADNQAIEATVRNINNNYVRLLNDFLLGMIPRG
ncbi:MAG: LPP20 family lipoprotein [Treponema sp.]|nr:LPP20 family lipoprotein [Treponema sp.]